MARVVILGAGVSGHTAALHLRRLLSREHEVVVVSPKADWNWIPSNIWVGVGKMPVRKVVFPLAPIYRRQGIDFRQAKAVAIWPEGDGTLARAVDIVYTDSLRDGQPERLPYDFLINATGPKLNFAATPGLGPDGHSWSVCTPDHAVEAARAFEAVKDKLRAGQRQRLVIGVGHGTCTCEGAAFEYAFNVEHELREAGLRDLAEVVYLTNEHELGDFGVGGMTFTQSGFVTSSQLWTESLFRERSVTAIVGAHVERVDEGKLSYETLDGTQTTLEFDFAMLLPPFRGADLQAFDRAGEEITSDLFAPNGFLRVDADYTPKKFEEWRAADWPSTYQSPRHPHLFGIGIAFAPPHAISRPRVSPRGTVIAPAPPRTGMPSGVMGREVAHSIADMINHGATVPTRSASMAAMGAACIASAGAGFRTGSAAAMTMYPVVPDLVRFPGSGRSGPDTYGEIGLAAHWIKHMLHHLFLYKAKARPGWRFIPE
ncbi:NAD(P)/FAD-dependent oxidoreductase [Pengzhenrongella frigida]|uniref:NAD(P)/FAD-dependent oxidoreductase n=1 Tax=Pengzhenrongella frigida TaxID=1259133 RepID=A0A4Q5N0J4_9MICO|nr:FAD/NAD(P)-binding oxidoreductase [Cellulomonas sp. HLT2-17]RYV49521.1 NAD(P)/FAD-dependent oxidoreductase [Cellulomonas sp. HLT2-17]